MFLEVVQAPVGDADALRGQIDRWRREVAPGARGWLGSTLGVTPEGTYVNCIRFESEAAARADTSRHEQRQWWDQTRPLLAGPAQFWRFGEVHAFGEGGRDDAGFVQIVHSRVADPDAMRDLLDPTEAALRRDRPELLGAVAALGEDGDALTVAYFTSEADARAGERRGPPAQAAEVLGRWQALHQDPSFLDLPEPILLSP